MFILPVIVTHAVVFIPLLLKITGQVEWSWWVACFPFMIPASIIAFVVALNVGYAAAEYVVGKIWIRLIKQFEFILFDGRKLRDQLTAVNEAQALPLAGSVYDIPKDLIMLDSSYLLKTLVAEHIQVMLVSDSIHDGGIIVPEGKEQFLRDKVQRIRRFFNHGAVNYIVRRDILKTTS